MPCDAVSPGRLIRMRTRSRRPSPSVSSGVSTNTVSSIALASANCGWVTPSWTFSHGGGVCAAAGAAVASSDRGDEHQTPPVPHCPTR